jgi:pyridoxamine 5'-phosphate oxidase
MAPLEVLAMADSLAGMRRDYEVRGLRKADLLDDPLAQFERWFDEARDAGLDRRGLTFFTNFDSRKARELAANPKAALLFWWPPQARQVRFEGTIEAVDDREADAYFASRPRGSQIGAWASAQSSVIADRAVLEAAEAEIAAQFADAEVPRPPFWGGYRLMPDCVEFWQGRRDRLHDRLRFTRRTDGWTIERLAP